MIEKFWRLLFVLVSFYFITNLASSNIEKITPTEITTRNGIIILEKEILNQILVQYLSIQDIFKLGFTSKSLFTKMIKEVHVTKGKYRISKICTVDIPENLFPYLTHLVQGCGLLRENNSQFYGFLHFPSDYNISGCLPQSYFSQHRVKLFHLLQILLNQKESHFRIKNIYEEMEGIYTIHAFGKTDSYKHNYWEVLVLPLYYLVKRIEYDFHIMNTEEKFMPRDALSTYCNREEDYGWHSYDTKDMSWISIKKVQMEDDNQWTLCWTDYRSDESMQGKIYDHSSEIRFLYRYPRMYSPCTETAFSLRIRFEEFL